VLALPCRVLWITTIDPPLLAASFRYFLISGTAVTASRRTLSLTAMLLAIAPLLAGCGLLPDASHRPVVRNPFPQLSRVAVAPFINLSDEPTVDGNQFALAYYHELQATQGFEVVPLAVVDAAMRQHHIQLHELNGRSARRLAQLLNVDAVVVGAVTEYSPYYPPRCGLRVEWYTANPCFHPIPPGYGLPWGTREEEFIPEPLVYEAELALAREQMATQTPAFEGFTEVLPPPPEGTPRLLSPPPQDESLPPAPSGQQLETAPPGENDQQRQPPKTAAAAAGHLVQASHDAPLPGAAPPGAAAVALPPNWPDPRGFRPPSPRPFPPQCIPSDKPVLEHTRVYQGNDADFTEALSSYAYFRDDARFGGWQSYLQRSDDFIRFCCHLHISEMLSARGGANKTQVVWKWSQVR